MVIIDGAFNLHSIIGTMIISVPLLSHLNACRTARSDRFVDACACPFLLIELLAAQFDVYSDIQSELSLISSLYLLLETKSKKKMKRTRTKKRSKRIRTKQAIWTFFSRNIVDEIWLEVWWFFYVQHTAQCFTMCHLQRIVFEKEIPPIIDFNVPVKTKVTFPIT